MLHMCVLLELMGRGHAVTRHETLRRYLVKILTLRRESVLLSTHFVTNKVFVFPISLSLAGVLYSAT